MSSEDHSTDKTLESVGQVVALETAILILWRQMPPELRATVAETLFKDLKTIQTPMFLAALQNRGLDLATAPRTHFDEGYDRAARLVSDNLQDFPRRTFN